MVAAFGLGAGAALSMRWNEAREIAVVAPYLAVLVLLLATDLDQRLLPDALTLPMIPAAALVLVIGWNPVLGGEELGVLSGIAAGVAFPLLFLAGSIVFRGGLGLGDVKLLVSVGLFSGVRALLGGLIVASLGFGLVVVMLLAVRRIGLRSYVPFGPVIIVAAAIAALGP